MMQYWISDGSQQFGPFPVDQLLSQGLQPHWLVWTEGMESWIRADAVDDLRPLFDPTPDSTHRTPPSAGPHPTQPTTPPPQANPGSTPQPVNYAGPTPQPVTPIGYHQPALPQTMAIVSLVCGLGGFLIGLPASIVAIVFGHIAYGRINRGEETGRGMALAGLILGYLLTGISVLFLIGFCAIPCMAGVAAF